MSEMKDDTGLSDADVVADMVNFKDNPRLADQYAAGDEERIAAVEAARMMERPKNGADVSTWVDYCVQLGAVRQDLEEEVAYNVSGRGVDSTVLGQYISPIFTKHELIELADRLGG